MANLPSILERHGIDTTTLTRLQIAHVSIDHILVSGSEAITYWHKLRALVHETSHWPVLLGHDLDLDDLSDIFTHQYLPDPASAIEVAQVLDVARWLRDHRASHRYRDDLTDADLYEEWPEDAQPFDSAAFLIPYNTSTVQPTPTHIGFVPTTVSWQVPALLSFGGWNRCPWPQEHASVLRRWQEQYGAEVVGMAGGRVELWVTHPPRDREAALRLAEEHFAYCPESVSHVTGTITQLAGALLDASVWVFGWD